MKPNFFALLLLLLVLASACSDNDAPIPIEQWEYDPSQIQTTDSGLQYVIHEEGTGNPPLEGALVAVHYSAFLTNGHLFDSSVRRGEPFLLTLGVSNLIEGWHQGIAMMRTGEKRTLIIPPHLAYGAMGSPPQIPPNATLIFDIELLSFSNP